MINKQQTDEDIRKIVVEALEQYNRSESGNWGMCLEYATTHIMKSFSATLSQVRKESYKKGYIDGGLAEIEANAVSDITIAQDKVEQIRTQAYEQGQQSMHCHSEACAESPLHECNNDCPVHVAYEQGRRDAVKDLEQISEDLCELDWKRIKGHYQHN